MPSDNPQPVPQSSCGDDLDFHHPFVPYDVQLQFMRTVYGVLQQGQGQIGILESPTGTGKSLSLICSALSWLRNHKKEQYEMSMSASREGLEGEPDWIIDHALRRKREELERQWKEREARMARIREEEKSSAELHGNKRRKMGSSASKAKHGTSDEETAFLLDDWNESGKVADDSPMSLFSKETRALMEKVGLGAPTKETEEDDDHEDQLKIIYTSRTHSQLSQFISELRQPTFPPSIYSSVADGTDEEDAVPVEGIKHIPLSSRQRLCINGAVSSLGSLSAINDRCTELQQSKSKEKCSFMPSSDNLSSTHQFRDTALATIPDIEDMFRLGKAMHVCPYYAARTALPGAEIITLPYPLLLQKSARDALGIKLEGNIVIVDEAHNIMDAVANVHAAEIHLSELRKSRQILGVYVKRFGKRLKGENRVMIAQVVRVLDALSEWLSGAMEGKGDRGIVDPNLLLKGRGADQVNLYTLIRYIQESKLAYKVEGYSSHVAEAEASAAKSTTSTPVLHNLVSFLAALTNLSSEGRLFYERLPSPAPDMKLSYLLLSPTHAFSSIAASARAVILAGGTMSPFADYKAHLFPYLGSRKITTLSCDHVIPVSSLCVWTLASTRPSTTPKSDNTDVLEFSFQKRGNRDMIRQLGAAILNVCSVVPDGVVVFFPSYGYLDEVIEVWQAQDVAAGSHVKPLWDRLGSKKAVFRDAKGSSSEEILRDYSEAILGRDRDNSKPATATNTSGGGTPGPRGGLLLSVVGGKMSEGINFSDRLGRCVIIVGLPYPNINSPEWKARSEYIESSTLARLTAEPLADGSTRRFTRDEAVEQSKQAARDFYENACMRAVNQSIGRAIRHRNDYAAIVLIDRRFGTERIKGKLPGWIRRAMTEGSEEKGLQGLMGALSGFFRGKKAQP